MSGFDIIDRIHRLEHNLALMGMKLARPKHHTTDLVAVLPKDENLPIYCRDAELFIGSLEETEVWLMGFRKSREYYQMLGLVTDYKVRRKEQDYRNRELLAAIKKSGSE